MTVKFIGFPLGCEAVAGKLGAGGAMRVRLHTGHLWYAAPNRWLIARLAAHMERAGLEFDMATSFQQAIETLCALKPPLLFRYSTRASKTDEGVRYLDIQLVAPPKETETASCAS